MMKNLKFKTAESLGTLYIYIYIYIDQFSKEKNKLNKKAEQKNKCHPPFN